jgi:hypothetical protein
MSSSVPVVHCVRRVYVKLLWYFGKRPVGTGTLLPVFTGDWGCFMEKNLESERDVKQRLQEERRN